MKGTMGCDAPVTDELRRPVNPTNLNSRCRSGMSDMGMCASEKEALK
jgi:hypothetical protein